MKMLIFAHVPPPHHGQSFMVQQMLAGFGGDCRKSSPHPTPHQIECYHVNARFSKKLEDIGDLRIFKFVLLLWYCLQAIWCRFRYGVKALYYVPAPGKRMALFRDWIVMFLCRPFFPRLFLHWHAAGLSRWLEVESGTRTRSLTYYALGNADMSITLSKYNQRHVAKLLPQQIRIVHNGITDPCPTCEATVIPRRLARLSARQKLLAGGVLTHDERADAGGDPEVFKVLYLAHCTREKGLFDTLDAVRAAQRQLIKQNSPIRLKLAIAGTFLNQAEHNEFDRWMAAEEFVEEEIYYTGFVSGAQKDSLLRQADLFSFPSYYLGENHPVNMIEALAYGLPAIVSSWRSLPDFLPSGYPGIVEPKCPTALSQLILQFMTRNDFIVLRRLFLDTGSLEQHLSCLAKAIHSINSAEKKSSWPVRFNWLADAETMPLRQGEIIT